MMMFSALALLAVGCAQTSARGGASDPAFDWAGQGQTTGHGSSDEPAYKDALADPGPF